MNPTNPMITIREAREDEIQAVATVLAPAFQDKIMAIVGDMEKSLKIIPTVIRAMDGAVFVAEQEGGQGGIIGAIIVTTTEPKFLASSLWVVLKNLGLFGTVRAYRVIMNYLKSVPGKLENEGILEAVGVDEGMRGKRVGELLVRKGEEYLKGIGYHHFGLGVKKESQAVSFYTRLGFVEAGEYENKLGCWLYMRKRLGGAGEEDER